MHGLTFEGRRRTLGQDAIGFRMLGSLEFLNLVQEVDDGLERIKNHILCVVGGFGLPMGVSSLSCNGLDL